MRDHVYQTLRANILNLELEPGRSISENEIAEQLEVSRTPVREAFLKLVQEELLEVYPQRGTFVSRINLDLVEEGRFMREHMERAVTQLACNHFPAEALLSLEANVKLQRLEAIARNNIRLHELDDEFHQTIFQGCKKERIWNSIQQLNMDFNRLRLLRLQMNLDWDQIMDHHQLIFEAIRDKDPVQGEQWMKQHLRLVVVEGDEIKAEHPKFFKS